MPFDSERASGEALLTLEASEAMRRFRAEIRTAEDSDRMAPQVLHVPRDPSWVPKRVIVIDGSTVTAPLRQGLPGADASLLKVSIVRVDLARLNATPPHEIPSPSLFREMDQVSTFDAVLPGANVVRKDVFNDSPSAFFRESVHDVLSLRIGNNWETLSETLSAIVGDRDPRTPPECPVEDCKERLRPGRGAYACHCPRSRKLFESDALRFVERFSPSGSNGESHGEVRHLLEVLSLFNILRYFAADGANRLRHLEENVFVLDGPLAMFGHAAWLTPYLRIELERISSLCRAIGFDLALFGFEKSGQFVEHFDRIDFHETDGPRRALAAGTVIAPNAEYINRRITLGPPEAKPHGTDTYFGRKILYKTRSNDHAVITTAMVDDASRTLRRNDLACYPRLDHLLNVLDHLSTYLYRDGFMPLVRAHAHAAIPVRRGSDLLRNLFADAEGPPLASEGPAGRLATARAFRP